MARKLLGRYIVVDPEICHGRPTFIGTRILAAQVLKQVARQMDWDEIVAEWRGSISREAIAEAVDLAATALGRPRRTPRRASKPAWTSSTRTSPRANAGCC
jgi:uncharacterized protein (DUF433 family)